MPQEGFIGGLETDLRRRIGRSGMKIVLILELLVHSWRTRGIPVRFITAVQDLPR